MLKKYRVYYTIPNLDDGGFTHVRATNEKVAKQIAIARIGVEKNISPMLIHIGTISIVPEE